MSRLLLLSLITLFACSMDDDDPVAEPGEFAYDFSSGVAEWTGGFADYPEGAEDQYELTFDYATLPAPLNESEGALRQSGTNGSDDLFMYVKRKLTGLTPSRLYRATFTVRFATDVPDGTVGIGGSPGESVFVKAGLTRIEPVTQLNDMDQYRLNIDKGNQANGGPDAIVLGDFANGTDDASYTLKELTNPTPFEVRTDDNGELWFLVGTDSGFEGRTTIYYDAISVSLD